MPLDPTDPDFNHDPAARRRKRAGGQQPAGTGGQSGSGAGATDRNPLARGNGDQSGGGLGEAAKKKAGGAAGAAIGGAISGGAAAKVGQKIGEKVMSDDAPAPVKKARKWALRGGIAAMAVQMLFALILFAPIGAVLTVILGNKIGQVASGFVCKADGALSSVGLKSKSRFCEIRDEVLDGISDEDKEMIENLVGEDVRTQLDCSNATPAERAAGLCIEGLIDYGEDNAGPVPPRAFYLVPIWQRAAEQYKVPWELIAAVNAARTNFGYWNCPATGTGGGFFAMSGPAWNKYQVDAGHAKLLAGRCPKATNPVYVRPANMVKKDMAERAKGERDYMGDNWFDPVDASFATARMLADQGAAGVAGWKYNGAPANQCTTPESDGRVYIAPETSGGVASGAKYGYNKNLDIPREDVVDAAKWRGKREPMPQQLVLRMLTHAWIAFGVDEQTARRNAKLNLGRVEQESGFRNNNPNNWDINAQNGTPSNGLFHFIQPTFDGYKVSGFDDMLNPLDNILAAVNAQVNATVNAAAAINGVLARTSTGWGPGGFKSGSNPYAKGGKATVVSAQDPSTARGGAGEAKKGTFKPVPYKGHKPDDKVSKAVQYFDGKRANSPCYTAIVHDWYEAIKENPPPDDSVSANAGTIRGRIVEIARKELKRGLRETGDNCGPPLDRYWGKGICGHTYPWCAAFATWVWKKAGVRANFAPGMLAEKYRAVYVPTMQAWGAARGLFHGPGTNYKPQPGDAGLYGGAHVNLVVKVTGDGHVNIGGNQGPGAVTSYPVTKPYPSNLGFLEPVKGNPKAKDGSLGSDVPAGSKPPIRQHRLRFDAQRKAQTKAYSRMHYGKATWKLTDPKYIILHFTVGSAESAFSTFSGSTTNGVPRSPATSAHFLIHKDGQIDQLVSTKVIARHVIGLNDEAIGIEMEEPSSALNILDRRAQLRSALRLVRWLQGEFDIPTSRVIGHNEARSDKPYYTEHVAASRNESVHGDWPQSHAQQFRDKL